MSRITGNEVAIMMDAYSAIYESHQEISEEQIWEEVENWVNSLLEEGHDLSDYTWEEMYEAYLSEDIKSFADKGGLAGAAGRSLSRAGTDKGKAQNRAAVGNFLSGINRGASNLMRTGGVFGKGGVVDRAVGKPAAASGVKSEKQGPSVPDRLKSPAATTPAASRPSGGSSAPAARPSGGSSAPAARPSGGSAKMAPSKPAAASQTGDKAKDMDTWAKANPKLAAAAAERSRTRGTSATTNPLMKDMKSRLPAPSTPSPTTSSTAFSKSTPSLSSSTPEIKSAGSSAGSSAFKKSSSSIGSSAFKPATTAAAASSSPSASGSVVPASNKMASTPKPTPLAPRQARLNMEMEYDAYDVVLEYLLDKGHAETVAEAQYIMSEMDAETIGSIIEAKVDERLPEHERSGSRLSRYDNPSGALALGGGQQRARREEHKERRGKKTKG